MSEPFNTCVNEPIWVLLLGYFVCYITFIVLLAAIFYLIAQVRPVAA